MADLSSTYRIIGTDLLMESAKTANDAYVGLIQRAWLSIFDQIEANALSAKALRLGQETSFSAQEAAKGMESLVKAGQGLGAAFGQMAAASDRAAASLAAACESSRKFEDEINEGSAQGERINYDKLAAAIEAAAEKAERGPRRKKRGSL